MAWTPPVHVTTGELATAATHNEQVLDNLSELRTAGFALSSQVAGDMLVAQSDTKFERLVSGKTANVQDAVVQRPEIKDYSLTTQSLTIGDNFALTINLESGNTAIVTLNKNITSLVIQNPSPTGKQCSFTIIFKGDGTQRTITWPGAVKWAGGVAPTPTSTLDKVDIYGFMTVDAGTTWYAFVVGQNF